MPLQLICNPAPCIYFSGNRGNFVKNRHKFSRAAQFITPPLFIVLRRHCNIMPTDRITPTSLLEACEQVGMCGSWCIHVVNSPYGVPFLAEQGIALGLDPAYLGPVQFWSESID